LELVAATFDYNLGINTKGYQLTIKMGFKKGATLSQVRSNLRDSSLLAQFNPNIKSVSYDSDASNDYTMEMLTQSWGVSSNLISNCHETESLGELWNRSCELSTRSGDGKKFMEWKKDAAFCALQKPSQEVLCRIDISGLAKPVTLAGLEIVSSRKFTLKAKEPALKHFLYLWLYGNQGSYSSSLAKNIFEEIGLRESVENAFQKAIREDQTALAEVKGSFQLPE
jgi:hypothetical protein